MKVPTFGGPLHRASVLLMQRLETLEGLIRGGDETFWPEYREIAVALAVILEGTQERPGYLTTKQLAERMGVSSKTIRRRVQAGQLTPAIEWGERHRVRRFTSGYGEIRCATGAGGKREAP